MNSYAAIQAMVTQNAWVRRGTYPTGTWCHLHPTDHNAIQTISACGVVSVNAICFNTTDLLATDWVISLTQPTE